MTLEWIIIETLAVFVENYVKIYFIFSQLKTKYNSFLSTGILLIITTGWGLLATFNNINQFVYNSVAFLLLLIGVCVIATAASVRKILITLLTTAISFVTTLMGIGIINLFTHITIRYIIQNQDSSRLLGIILVKMIQIIVFLLLSKKPLFHRNISRTPSPVLIINSILAFVVNLFIWFYLSATLVESKINTVLLAASVCTMLILLGGFIMYDIFAKLEQQKLELSSRIQRTELESTFREEVKNMHADLQKWRHEYKNNLIALRGYVTDNNMDAALEYIDRIADMPLIGKPLISTNNAALDAIINSKLWSAVTRGIKVSAQSVFPSDKNIRVTDDDLCSIIGNLLDNSTEACERMEDDSDKFLTFELLVKGDNLFLMIYNSYSGEIIRDGDTFVSSKSSIYNGNGIKHINTIIDKYEGFSKREYNNGVFFTQVMIPLLTPKHGGSYDKKGSRWFHRSLDKRRTSTRG